MNWNNMSGSFDNEVDVDDMYPGVVVPEGALMEEAGMEKGEAVTNSAFVDYAPPPRPPVPPPAKYKLCFVIWVLIYFVSWFAEEAEIIPALLDAGFRIDMAFFILFMLEIFVMVYFGVEIFIGLVGIKIGGVWYGILPWIMQPRCQWVKESDNVFMECLAVVVKIAEDGFEIFSPPTQPKPPQKPRVYDLVDKHKVAVLRAKHKIDPEKTKLYDEWCESMMGLMESQPGYISAVKESVDDDNVHTWKLTFVNVVQLNSCMSNPSWVRMVGELESLLDKPKVTQILMENPPLDAFADSLTPQGQATPSLPPKKWKVWWTTTCSLFFTRLIMNVTAIPYFIKWGWIDWHPQAFRLVSIGTLVLILNYITNPATQLLVGHWMIRKPEEKDTKFPWKQLNDGPPNPVKLVCLILFFVGCAIKWGVKD